MTIEPLGRKVSVYSNGTSWNVVLFIAANLPTRAAAEAAAEAFVSAYSAGWRDGLRDLWALWREAKAVDAAGWNVRMFGEWLRGTVGRLAPGVVGAN